MQLNSLYLLINQKMKNNLRVTQNKSICFVKNSTQSNIYREKESKQANWLLTKERVEQRIAAKVFNYWEGASPLYLNELFAPSRNTYNIRSHMVFEIPSKKSNLGQKSISFIGLSLWDNLTSQTQLFRLLIIIKSFAKLE